MTETAGSNTAVLAGRIQRRILLAAMLLTAAIGGCAAPLGAGNRPLSVWAADARQEVRPGDRGPGPADAVYDAVKGEVTLTSAINQTVGFQLAMLSGIQPVRQVDVQVGELRNEGGQPLRATVRMYRAWPVEVRVFQPWQRLYRQDPCVPRQVYDVLVPAESMEYGLPADLPVSTMLLTWIELHVEKGNEPGTYAGSVRVTSQGQPAWVVNLTLQVQPLALPDEPAMPAMARFDARQLCRMHLTLKGRPYAPVRLSEHDPVAEPALKLLHATARLFHAHGVVAVPTGYEPAIHVDGRGQVRIEWSDYDRLVQPLVDGTAFDGRVRPAAWPVPLDAEHPPMPDGGSMTMATYESLLRQVVQQTAEHFHLRRWERQAYAEIDPGGAWPEEYAQWQQRIAPTIVQEQLPLLLRLPPEEMGAYGWHGWPATAALSRQAAILSVPGRFFLYGVNGREGLRMWLRPDHPPFAPSLAVGSGAIDPAAIGWAAWRLKAAMLDLPDQRDWPETREIVIDSAEANSDRWLIWPGAPWGLAEPVPSIRLKRLAMGLAECKWMYLLRQHGRIHVDELLAASLVPLAGSLAYGRQHAEGLDGEIQLDKPLWDVGVSLMVEEVKMAMAGVGSDERASFTNTIAWRSFLQKTRRVQAWAEPARLRAQADGTIQMQVPVEILNLKAEPVRGTLRWERLPGSWSATQEKMEFGPVEPFQRTRVMLTAAGPGVGVNAAGHAECAAMLELEGTPGVEVPVRLSAVAALPLRKGVRVDGDLSDWPAGRSNQAAGFQVFGRPIGGDADPATMRPTHAFVGTDGKMLYIAARMQDTANDIRVSQRNTVQYQSGLPVGEDLVEILIDPDNGAGGGPERLMHIVVKANGAAVANMGVDLWPPVCNPQPLGARVAAATRIYQDAWTAEVAIPLEAIRAVRPEGAYWGLGICRLRAANLEYSSWSGARVSCYHPSALGNLLVP